MAKYKNIGNTNVTVRGITLKPGETKDVKGFSNDPNLLRCSDKPTSDNKIKKKPEESDVKADLPIVKPVESEPPVKSEDKPESAEPKKDDKQNAKSGKQ